VPIRPFLADFAWVWATREGRWPIQLGQSADGDRGAAAAKQTARRGSVRRKGPNMASDFREAAAVSSARPGADAHEEPAQPVD